MLEDHSSLSVEEMKNKANERMEKKLDPETKRKL
jgi:hypothetical protein